MRVRLVPSHTRDWQLQTSSTFLVDDTTAVDAGSCASGLTVAEQRGLQRIFLTHSHLDHVGELPFLVAEVFGYLEEPIDVFASRACIRALRRFLFNDEIWPDFERILLDDGRSPLAFHEFEPGQSVSIGNLRVRAVAVNHTVPTQAYLVEDGTAAVVFPGDTYTTDEVWREAREHEGLRCVFPDVSFPESREALARAAKHYTPRSLAEDLEKLRRPDVEVQAVHIKPSCRSRVIEELGRLERRVTIAEIGREQAW